MGFLINGHFWIIGVNGKKKGVNGNFRVILGNFWVIQKNVQKFLPKISNF
uniref:Uncharacterized protein n=1 Tax=viral metagenome TaxID=1070528 RepID=A0A6C0BSE7_9ZZZZ